MEQIFLGKPFSYWIKLNDEILEKGTDELLQEVIVLRGKVSYYESRIKEMHDTINPKP